MTVRKDLETLYSHCGSTGVLLDLLVRHVRADQNEPERHCPADEAALRLAQTDAAFAEFLTDALCLYLQRPVSHLDKAGAEFEPLLQLLAELHRPRSGPDLMAWIDRQRTLASPTGAQEKRFALAIWSLMKIFPPESKVFVEWWTERAKHHRGDWLGEHFDPKAIEAKS
jgi:hypothetical protein